MTEGMVADIRRQGRVRQQKGRPLGGPFCSGALLPPVHQAGAMTGG